MATIDHATPEFPRLPELGFLHTLGTKLITTIVIFSLIPFVRADGGDEFANNLFTDLAPILALFGEQVAKQFLSESSGWADNILFAMAPLGIITGIVSAIRVAGHPLLRAIVGRGKEGRAQVELELMSSNSPDVGEMWNGQAIVRVLGAPSIFQLIYAPGQVALNPVDSIGVLDNNNPFFRRTTASLPIQQDPPDMWDEDYDIELPELLPGSTERSHLVGSEISPPNISLNARGEPVSNKEKWSLAIIGIAVQLIVLVYGSLISYHPGWRPHFLKNGSRPSPEALPFTIVGTVALNLGMLICSYVIDQASTEEKWILKDSESPMGPGGQRSTNCKVAWIQKGGTVNDQLFEPYIIIGHEGQKVIRTSHRCNKKTITQLRYLVLAGTFVSIPGFVIQFIGLRGVHWSVTIAQLSATIVMTIVRSFVRRRLIKEPEAVGAFEGYELDCMARKIGECAGWKIVSECPKYPPSATDGRPEDGGLGDRVLQVRKCLGELSKWPTDMEDLGQALCIAMERTINTIFNSEEFHLVGDALLQKGLEWKLAVLTFGHAPCKARYGELTFKIERSQSWEPWEISQDTQRQIIAVMSLWMHHFREEESRHLTLPPGEDVTGGLAKSAKVLVWPSHNVDQGIFNLWIGHHQGIDIRHGDPKDISRQEGVPRYRFIGKQEGWAELEDLPMVAIIPNTSVEKLFAQQIFSDFFSAVVSLVKKISGPTKPYHDSQGNMQGFRNSALSQLVEIVSDTGLGTLPEILMSELPLLSSRLNEGFQVTYFAVKISYLTLESMTYSLW